MTVSRETVESSGLDLFADHQAQEAAGSIALDRGGDQALKVRLAQGDASGGPVLEVGGGFDGVGDARTGGVEI